MYKTVVRMVRFLIVLVFVCASSVSHAFEFPAEPEFISVPSMFTGERWSPAVVQSWDRTENTVWEQCGRVLFSYSSSFATGPNILKCLDEVAVVNNRSTDSLGRLQPGEVVILPLTRSQVAAYEGRVIDNVDATALATQLKALRGEFEELTAKLADVENTAENAEAKADNAAEVATDAKATADAMTTVADKAQETAGNAMTEAAGAQAKADAASKMAVDAKATADTATKGASDAKRLANEALDSTSQLEKRMDNFVTKESLGQLLKGYVLADAGNPVSRKSDLEGFLTADDASNTYLQQDAVEPSPTVWGWEVEWWWIWVAVVTLALIVMGLFLRSRTDRKSIASLDERVGHEESDQEESATGIFATLNGLVPISRMEKVEQQLETLEKGVKVAGAKADRALGFAAETARFGSYMLVGDTTKVPFTQHELEVQLVNDGDSVIYSLAQESKPEDVRRIRFTRVNKAFDDGRPGLKIEGVSSQRHPIALEMSKIFSKFRSAANGGHLLGMDSANPEKKVA